MWTVHASGGFVSLPDGTVIGTYSVATVDGIQIAQVQVGGLGEWAWETALRPGDSSIWPDDVGVLVQWYEPADAQLRHSNRGILECLALLLGLTLFSLFWHSFLRRPESF